MIDSLDDQSDHHDTEVETDRDAHADQSGFLGHEIEENEDNNKDEDKEKSDAEALNSKKVQKHRRKLTFEFFKSKHGIPENGDEFPASRPSDEDERGQNDLLWTFFLDVVAQFPTLEEQVALDQASDRAGELNINRDHIWI